LFLAFFGLKIRGVRWATGGRQPGDTLIMVKRYLSVNQSKNVFLKGRQVGVSRATPG
jgi:hypothetical protein